MGTQLPPRKEVRQPPLSRPYLLWPNGHPSQQLLSIDNRALRAEYCIVGIPHKTAIFGPCLLWLNGWMDQDTTWYGRRPRPRPHCVGWGPSSPTYKKEHSPQFSAHVCCGQTAGWIKMPLGTQVRLGPGHIVLRGDQAPQKGHSPNFRSLPVAKWLDGSRCQLIDRLP